jgi:hypothetical protein
MTEYEALDLVDGVFGSLWAVSQFGFGLVSAYCLLAYYTGAKLSFFQVTFVNICFFVMNDRGQHVPFQRISETGLYFRQPV